MIAPNTYHDIERELKARLVDRDEEIHGLSLASLSGQHLELLGPPGNAKSWLIRAFAEYFNARHFQWLLTPDTSPDEILGPVDISQLKIGVYSRVTKNKLPEAEIAYLDEVYKANSRLLNATLGILQERKFNNNGSEMDCPLLFCVGSSNELPDDDAHLQAFRDRFVLRFNPGYITHPEGFISMLELEASSNSFTVSVDELKVAQVEVSALRMAQETKDSMSVLWERIREAGIIVSDRRYKQMLSVMAAESWLMGADCITAESLIVGCNILWDTTDQIRVVAQIVRESINPYASQAEEIMVAARQAIEDIDNGVSVSDSDKGIEMLQVTRQIQEMDRIILGLPTSAALTANHEELVAMSAKLVTKMINANSNVLPEGSPSQASVVDSSGASV